ncbi:glycosyltransferase family 4 protein [Hyphomicrobium denitrificans]|nr:glycosyltransferase family 4 protein [Hyphomicrobium denitrificans]
MRIALLFRSYGPYHLARLDDLRLRASVLALEFSDFDGEYDWGVTEEKRTAGVISLSKRQEERMRSLQALDGWLKNFSPDVVAIPGYAEPFSLLAVCLCQGLGIPTVLMSDSHALNGQRNPIRDSLKRHFVSLFDAALVAGTPQTEYLARLGFPRCRISTGYDVVDNRHFARNSAQRRPILVPQASGSLHRPHFLCCSRLVEGKNLMFLIGAFRRYRDKAAEKGWDLTIAGDGPLYGIIARRVAELSLTEHVHLIGRKAYDELPALYASADALVFPSLSETWGLVVNEAMAAGLPVLVSKGVGCHPDLVQEGINGRVFDPANTAQLATLLYEIANTPNRQAMGDASLRIIRDWDLNRFSSGLIEAAVAAYSSRSHKKPRAAVAMAAALSYRASTRAADHTIRPK